MSSVTCNAAGLPPLARPGRLPRGRRWRPTTRATCGGRRNVGRGWRVGAFPVWAFGFGHIAGCEAPAGPLHGPQKQMGEYRHVLGNMRLSVQFADAGRARHGRHRTSPALHVTRKTRSRRLAVAPLHHGASRCTMEHHDATGVTTPRQTVKASPHRHKWMLSHGAPADPSDPWNSHAAPVSPRQNGQRVRGARSNKTHFIVFMK